ncbi:MAG: TetR family transcriptional regulator [Hyphomicrobiales bacterium]
MMDDYTKRGLILRSALRLAAEKGWKALTLAEIAAEAGATLADVHKDYGSKSDILKAFVRDVDRELLKRAPAPDMETPARDRLLDVVMTRFEILEPYKAALGRIVADVRRSPDAGDVALLCSSACSARWMLDAAGIPSAGGGGAVRVAGLMALYGRVSRVWLADDDPGLEKTMAALDREIGRGARWLGLLDGVCRTARSFVCQLLPGTGARQRAQAAAAGR